MNLRPLAPLSTVALLALLAMAVLLSSAACGATGGGAEATGTRSRRISVLAASSLTDALTRLEPTFEREHDGVDVRLSFAASSSLVRQVADGAPADVIVTADERTMQSLVDGARVGPRTVVATNRLAIVVEDGNPRNITALPDLGRADVKAVLCAEQVPCGALARAALDRARVTLKPVSFEENVKAVVAKVALGEADAGVAYVSDGTTDAGVDAVPLGHEFDDVHAVYPAAVVRASKAQRTAAAFIAFLRSDAAQRELQRAGFGPPP